MICVRKILALFIIFMMLVPFVCAGDTKHVGDEKVVSEKPTTEKVTDKTKEKTTEITSKDKSITGKITVTDNDISKYKVEKKSSTEISISKEEAKGEHTKAKVSFPKSELQKIDIDKDGKFGILHISDTGEVTHTTATEAELVAGKVMTFSTNIVNGYSGYKQYTFSDVESGDTLNIDDVSGNYTITAAIDGVVPTYTAWNKTNASTYPQSSNLTAAYLLNGNAIDISENSLNGTVVGTTIQPSGLVSDGVDSHINLGNNNKFSYSHTTGFSIYCNFSSNYTGTGTYPMLVSKSWNAYGMSMNGGKIRLTLHDGSVQRTYESLSSYSTVSPNQYVYTYKTGTLKLYKSNLLGRTVSGIASLNKNTAAVGIGSEQGTPAARIPPVGTTIHDVFMWNTNLTQSDVSTLYAGGSGISFQPEPSYNFTGYDVASGVEKVLDTDSTCTGIEYVDTTGGTHDVTITVYFTKDITVISDSHTALVQTVNISHTSSNTAQDGELIPYDILDEYFGTIDFDTTNPNATITRNATDFMVDTGYITANTTYYYNVSIPNYVEEMVWSDWDPTNETCNAKVQIGNSTPYTTWNITTYNVTNGSLYKLVYASNGTEVGNATAANGSASIIILGLVDGVYWLTETPVLTGFVNVPAVAVTVVIVAGGAIGASFIGQWYRKRRK